MRIIKFRAWDIKNKVMLDLDDSGIDTYCLHISKNSLWLSFDNSEDDEKYIPPEDFTLMQFIGLFDKNGKEIYEGDIVKECSWIDWEKNKNRLWREGQEIVCDNDSTSFRLKDEDGISCFPIDKNCGYEVIGNIYENRELLKGDENG